MLVLSNERVVPSQPNVLTLTTNDGRYLYVHCKVYGDAAIIADKFGRSTEALVDVINEGATEVPAIVTEVYELLPHPVNILAYYLLLIKTINVEELTVEEAIGALHAISNCLDFRLFPTLLAETRKNVRFTMMLVDEYKLSYDQFFQTAIPFERLTTTTVSSSRGPLAEEGVSPAKKVVDEEEEEVVEVGEHVIDPNDLSEESQQADLVALQSMNVSEMFSLIPMEPDEDQKDEEAPAVTAPAPAPEPEPAPAAPMTKDDYLNAFAAL